MHILCPHCHNPIEVVQLKPGEEIACPSCGSSFSVEPGSTTGLERPAGQKLGKYELIDTVGQGAFGTVYKARDPELDRVVAIKVPRAGNLAGPQELDRFLREARSVAQLRHPSIVTVHDVGQADGVPYLVSDFVEGVTLSDLLSARRPGFREAAALVAAVADALQYAHERGVVHRDVKPSNIMIGPDGAAFVMDFGLAKREAGEITMTVEGQVLGTPAYMSPEQARGEGHAVDARGDVYSLGVVLYQLLTGELPFRGTTRMLLHQVLHDEPRRPRSLNDHIPRDLETIALKAMAKEPSRRYATAGALADDLRRWEKGQAIHARPVGRLERAVRWVKRNPALAASLATVVGVSLIATMVSTLFGVDARDKEVAAESARNDLAKKNIALEQSQAEVVKKNTALEQSQDKVEGALARTWLSPLAETPSSLTDAEIGAFTELAANRNSRLAERFVTEALRDRQGIRRLRARSAFALHAVVGLDIQKRQEVERQFLRALEASDMLHQSRTDLALAAAELGELTPPTAALVAQTLLQALANTSNPTALRSQTEALSAVVARLEPTEADRVSAAVVDALTRILSKTTAPFVLANQAEILSAVVPRLKPAEAKRLSAAAAAALAQAMSETTDPNALATLAKGLSGFATRVEFTEAARASAFLTQALSRMTDPTALAELARGLSMLAVRLDAKDAKEAAVALTQALSKTNDSIVLASLAQCLSALVNRLEASEAARVSTTAVATLLETLSKTNDATTLANLSEGLSALAARLEPREAKEAATAIAKALSLTTDAFALESLAHSLLAVTDRLEAKEATRMSAEAAALLTLALSKTTDANTLANLAEGLLTLAPRLEPKEAKEAAAAIAQALSKRTDFPGIRSLPQGLSVLADRLETKDVGQLAATLAQAMSKTNDTTDLAYLAQGLSALADRLETKEATRAFSQATAALKRALSKATDLYEFADLAQGLSALADHLEPKEAARATAETAAALARALSRMNNPTPSALLSLARGLSALAPHLEPQAATEAAVALTSAMSKAKIAEILRSLSAALSAVLGDGQRHKRAQAVAAAVAGLHDNLDLTGTLLLLRPAVEPFPRRLSDQELVELLKHPLCVGESRRVVLDHLGTYHQRAFADQWEFVRFAEEQKLGLDFTTPPKRP